MIAGLARETERIRLGVLVSPVTFRHPGAFAKAVATVHEMSGGRVEVGLGAGWNEDEHRRHGFAFPPIAERADMLEEQLAIVRGLWTEPDGWSFDGPPLPGRGHGLPRSPGAAPGADRRRRGLAALAPDRRPLRRRVQRDRRPTRPGSPTGWPASTRPAGPSAGIPATIRRSAMVGTLVARDAAELAARKAALLDEFGTEAEAADWFASRERRWIVGTPEQARARVAEFAAAGVERLMLQDFLPRDMDMIDLLGEALVRA